MAVFKVQAVNPETGKEQWVQVEAFTPDMAEDEVNDKGLLVGKVRVADELPPNAPVFESLETEHSELEAVAIEKSLLNTGQPDDRSLGTAFFEQQPILDSLLDPVVPAGVLPPAQAVVMIFVSAMLRVAGGFVLLFGLAGGWTVYRLTGGQAGLPDSGVWGLGSVALSGLMGLLLFAAGEAARCLVNIATDLRAIRSGMQH